MSAAVRAGFPGREGPSKESSRHGFSGRVECRCPQFLRGSHYVNSGSLYVTWLETPHRLVLENALFSMVSA
jgi:hypothetical protein